MRSVILLFVMANLVGGCEDMTTGQKGAVTGAALGTGIGIVAGGSFGQVVGAGLIGGAAGYAPAAPSAAGNPEACHELQDLGHRQWLAYRRYRSARPATAYILRPGRLCNLPGSPGHVARSAQTLAGYLAEHAAQFRGVTIPNDDRGTQIAYLVRGGCTLAPDAYLFTVIDRAIQAEIAKLPKR